MTATDTTLKVLSDAECSDLLRRHRVGRLGLAIEGWPAVLPVNYLFDGASIVIRTDVGSKLEEAPLTAVAFEIDDADRFGEWGWSVLAQGPAFDITDSVDQHSLNMRQLPVRPFVAGAKDHWLMISVARLSGRSFGRVSE